MVCTGSPVRPEITAGHGNIQKQKLGFDSRPVILVFGGSIGAMAINQLVWNNIQTLSKNITSLILLGEATKTKA